MHYEQQMIRERAYSIWQREGCHDGRAFEHWTLAEREIKRTGSARAHAAVQIEGADPTPDLPKRRRRPAATTSAGTSNGRATSGKKSTRKVTENQ